MTRPCIRGLLLLVAHVSALPTAHAQDGHTKTLDNFSGSVGVMSNGISTIPNLSLGKPAAAFIMAAEKNGLSFEPEFRFSLEGQPWVFLFWWRYDLVRKERFQVDVGLQPAVSFRPFDASGEGTSQDVLEARRFLAGELSAQYRLASNVRVGVYYLYSHGFEPSTPDHIHYLSFNGSVPSLRLPNGFALGVRPQLYYLNIDARDGFYATMNLALSNPKLPLSVTSTVNIPLRTRITGSPDFLWNVGLVYAFDLVD